MKKLNTILADIEETLLRLPNTLSDWVDISTLIQSLLGFDSELICRLWTNGY